MAHYAEDATWKTVKARAYIDAHPEWKEATVGLALAELEQARFDLRNVGNVLQGCNAYANGHRYELDKAFDAISREIQTLEAYWREPVEEERDES